MNDPIDIVVPWVDGNDPEWQERKRKAMLKSGVNMESSGNVRYESWDFKYWFRAVEKNMPWVNKIFVVVSGRKPDFLDLSNKRLCVVSDTEYIPDEYLPTFNSNTIEMNLHRIPELSENFIAMCDDIFPLQPIEEEYYFRDNILCDEAVETPLFPKRIPHYIVASYKDYNNVAVINKHFDKRKVQETDWDKWYCEDYGELLDRTRSMAYWNTFTGFRNPHLGFAQKKSTLAKLWEIEKDTLDTASRNCFRGYSDVSHWLCRYWQLCTGEFLPRRTRGKFLWVDINNYQNAVDIIENRRERMLCLAELCTPAEFGIINAAVSRAFEKVFPEKSSYER